MTSRAAGFDQADMLREQIAADLRALREMLDRAVPGWMGPVRKASMSAWVAGALAGVLAGAWSATRRRAAGSTSGGPPAST